MEIEVELKTKTRTALIELKASKTKLIQRRLLKMLLLCPFYKY
ncbi:Uncharacterised protein [Capnocytophaga ochracea]|uniref:Uncharacterized protein n=1 Tax=Capnocytophaga ochracea TaxID=1018 RepID=A0A2X2USZ5_CAPOC|nr:Uncharacterised protein [Capnocytophaga ochracea]